MDKLSNQRPNNELLDEMDVESEKLMKHIAERKELSERLENDPEFKKQYIKEQQEQLKEIENNYDSIEHNTQQYINDFMETLNEDDPSNASDVDMIDMMDNMDTDLEDYIKDLSLGRSNIDYKPRKLKNCTIIFHDYEKFEDVANNYKLYNCKIVLK